MSDGYHSYQGWKEVLPEYLALSDRPAEQLKDPKASSIPGQLLRSASRAKFEGRWRSTKSSPISSLCLGSSSSSVTPICNSERSFVDRTPISCKSRSLVAGWESWFRTFDGSLFSFVTAWSWSLIARDPGIDHDRTPVSPRDLSTTNLANSGSSCHFGRSTDPFKSSVAQLQSSAQCRWVYVNTEDQLRCLLQSFGESLPLISTYARFWNQFHLSSHSGSGPKTTKRQ